MPDAVELLREDHRKVQNLFEEFDEAEKRENKRQVAEKTMMELEIHSKLEEEIFYPVVRKTNGDKKMTDKALKEHHEVEKLIGELRRMKSDDEDFDAKFDTLVDNVNQHIQEEESEILPAAEQSDLALEDIGQKMAKRKEQLQEKMQNADAKAIRRGGAKSKSSPAKKKRR
jgi:hemerythrin-like domain-containing protein